MTDISAVEIPKPTNWQDFQRNCIPLFRVLVNDPTLHEFGREGQKQDGIDLFGYRDRNLDYPIGVQCRRLKDPITASSLRKTVDGARDSDLQLTEIIFATTADHDANIQREAAKLTSELQRTGWKCRISVMGWQALQAEIARTPDALKAFWPGAYVEFEQVTKEIVIIRDKEQEQTQHIFEIKQLLATQKGVLAGEVDPDLPKEAHGELGNIHSSISTLRDIIFQGKTKTAIEGLEKLKKTVGTDTPYAQFRIPTNIGFAHHVVGRDDKALICWKQALELRPTDPQALTNVALGELAAGNVKAALKLSRNVLNDHPENAFAAAILVQASVKDQSISDPLTLVSKDVHASREVILATTLFYRNRRDVKWHELAKRGLDEFPEDEILIRFAAEAELEIVLRDSDVLLGKASANDYFQIIKGSADKLSNLWEPKVDAEEVDADELRTLSQNIASALHSIGCSQQAGELIDRTIKRVGRSRDLIRIRALVYLEEDKDEEALALLQDDEIDPELELLVCEIESREDPAKALEKLKNISLEELPKPFHRLAAELQCSFSIQSKDKKSFEKGLEQLKKVTSQGSINVRLQHAKALDAGIKIGNATAQEDRLLNQRSSGAVNQDTIESQKHVRHSSHISDLILWLEETADELSFSVRVEIAHYLESHDEFEAASDILHGYISLERDTPALRTYLIASIGAHITARAEEALDKLPSSISEGPFYKRMAATLYWNIGDVERAAPLIDELNKVYPDRLALLLWRIDAMIRLDQSSNIQKLLKPEIEDSIDGPVDEQIRLAQAFQKFGQPERGIAFAYRIFMLNRDDPRAWMAFMGIVFSLGETRDDDDKLLSKIANEFSVVKIRDPQGDEGSFAIENDDKVRKVRTDAIDLSHGLVAAVRGLSPGAMFRWPFDQDGEAELLEVKHKYLYAFHEALELYNKKFPAEQNLTRLQVNVDKPDGLDEIKAQLKGRSDYVAEQAGNYAKGNMTLALLAHMTGSDIITTMLGLDQVGVSYRVAIGIEEERDLAFKSIKRNSSGGCVLDAPTLHIIRRLELEQVVEAVCGPIGITQSTADLLQTRLDIQKTFGGKKHGSMSYEEGGIVLYETDPNQDKDRLTLLKDDLQWIRDNAQILAAQPATDPPEMFRKLGSLTGVRILDEAYAASGSGRLLVVDDLLARNLGHQLEVHSTWLQPVLMVALEKKIIATDDYSKAIVNLIDIGQTFISVDPHVLWFAMEEDRLKKEIGIGRHFLLACRFVGGAHAEPNSHTKLVTAFLIRLWSSKSHQEGQYEITSHVLRALLGGRRHDHKIILSTLYHGFGGMFSLRTYLRQWAFGHFMRWP